ncbi:RNA polymerase sigma factor [Sphingomonas oryzagri]
MTVSRERAVWLGSNIFPHEAGLRRWLARRPAESGLEIDDIVQETYAILASLEQVDHIRNPRTYLFEVAKSVVRQALRRSRVVTIDSFMNADVMLIPEDAPSPERVAADREELRHVSTAIGSLPVRCREVFTLRKLQGLSQRDVAGRLGIAESTVEKHMIKALTLLTDAIGRGGFRSDPASSVRDEGQDAHSRDAAGRCERA